MKRTAAILLLISLLLLISCSERACAADVAAEFCRAYSLDGRVYSSLAKEGEDGYIDDEMLHALYGDSDCLVTEFAIVLYGKVSTVREIGVFIAENGSERMELLELATDRVSFLSSFADGEGFVKKYRAAVVYGFVDDASRAEGLLDSLI